MMSQSERAFSLSESERFGRPISRIILAEKDHHDERTLEAAVANSAADVVILRHPSQNVLGAMHLAAGSGSTEISISTQVHDLPVISTRAKMGRKPTKAVTTVHLVKRGLIRT